MKTCVRSSTTGGNTGLPEMKAEHKGSPVHGTAWGQAKQSTAPQTQQQMQHESN